MPAVTEASNSDERVSKPGEAVGDPGFDVAFDDLFRAAYRVAFRLLGSREDAADCAQEACTRTWADWDKVVRGGNPLPWTVRVSSNLAIDRWRRARRADRFGRSADIGAFDPGPERLDLYRALDGLPRRRARGRRAPPPG